MRTDSDLLMGMIDRVNFQGTSMHAGNPLNPTRHKSLDPYERCYKALDISGPLQGFTV